MTNQTEILNEKIYVFKQIAIEKGGVCLSENYINSKTKLLYECKNGHQWFAVPYGTLKGQWCQKCAAIENAKKKKDTIGVFKRIAAENGGKCLSENYSNQHDRLHFECKKGHQWYARAANVKHGDWCRKCSYKIIAEKKKLDIKLLQEIAVKKGGRLISKTYEKSDKKLLWECSEKHQWWSAAQNIRAGHWCKKCSSKKASQHLKKSIEDCKKLAKLNDGLCLSVDYINNQTNLLWKCKNGHIWEATYANVNKGTWCKICSRKQTAQKRKTPLSYFQQYAISKGGICLSKNLENQNSILKFQCSEGHIWEVKAGSIRGGHTWCRICAGSFKADTPELQLMRLNKIQKISKSHGGECLSKEYVNSKTKLQFKCKEGHVWWTTSSVILKGHWCNICSSNRAGDFSRDDIEIFKNIIEKKGGKCLTEKYVNQQTRILIECDKGHQWYAHPGNLKNRGDWCRICNGSAPHELQDIIKLAESRGGECLSENYKNDMTKVLWKCSEGHTWEATPNNIKRGKWCPTCSSGIGERACRLCFEKIFNRQFNKVRPNWLRNKSGFIMELDGYNEELKLAFEHQGSQHYSLKKSNHRFLKENLKQNDAQKAEICKTQGITIIYILEVFTDTKLNDLISFILQELDRFNISYPIEAHNIILDPKEVYTYTRTKEVKIREERAKQILEDNDAELVDIYRINSGVKIKVKCKNNHTLVTRIGTVINGQICRKCDNI